MKKEKQTMAGVPAERGGIPSSSTRECSNALITEGKGGVEEQVCCGPPPGTTPPPPLREGGTEMGRGMQEGWWRVREGQSLAH